MGARAAGDPGPERGRRDGQDRRGRPRRDVARRNRWRRGALDHSAPGTRARRHPRAPTVRKPSVCTGRRLPRAARAGYRQHPGRGRRAGGRRGERGAQARHRHRLARGAGVRASGGRGPSAPLRHAGPRRGLGSAPRRCEQARSGSRRTGARGWHAVHERHPLEHENPRKRYVLNPVLQGGRGWLPSPISAHGRAGDA